MLDGKAKFYLDPYLARMGRLLAGFGITANHLTIAGFVLGVAAASMIGLGHFIAGLILMLLSRLCDGLDGAVARALKPSDFGGFLDIVLDFAFYGAIPFGFVIADPGANAVAGSALILAFYINGASFLAYAVMAEKRALRGEDRGKKSLYFTTGLAEASETLAVFVAMCLFPAWFAILAWVFALICLYTAFSRIMLAARTFH